MDEIPVGISIHGKFVFTSETVICVFFFSSKHYIIIGSLCNEVNTQAKKYGKTMYTFHDMPYNLAPKSKKVTSKR